MFRSQEWNSSRSGLRYVPAKDLPPIEVVPGEPGVPPQPAAEAPARPAPDAAKEIIAKDIPAREVPANDARRGTARNPRLNRRKVAVAAALAVAAGAGGWFGYNWWTVGRFTVSTDDAYVRAYDTTLAAKVPGYLATMRVQDGDRVRAGEAIATIDDGDYGLAVDSAREKVATQEAAIARIGHQIDAQQAAVAQAKAQIASAEAAAKRWDLELARQNFLATKEFASRQTLEQAQANRDQAAAAVQSAQAALNSATANVDVLKGQQQEAIAGLNELKTALAKAERDLSFTTIRAPIDGMIGNRAVQVGDYMQPGQRLASLVPLDKIYVDANFKETQLAGLRPGQSAVIAVDALPEHDIRGTIESLSPASGAVFSLLPPDNATGNFTKIVQRLPVRIGVPSAVAREGVLRPGMSVVVSVNTKADTPAAPDALRNASR